MIFPAKMKYLIRKDTGEQISTDIITEPELQEEMSFS